MPPGEAHPAKHNHTARTSLSINCGDLLDAAPKDWKAADAEIPIVFVVVTPAGRMKQMRLLMPRTPPSCSQNKRSATRRVILVLSPWLNHVVDTGHTLGEKDDVSGSCTN
jgi:hypothetical protein